MDAAAAQERTGKYDAALAGYRAALQTVANDEAAKKKIDFCQAMSDGMRAVQQRKFPDAVKAFEAAVKLFPDDAAAKQSLQRTKAGK